MANPNIVPRFKPGQSGNPGGKPVGARNRISKAFLETLANDFDLHGKAALETARAEDPMGYIKAVAGLLPKEFIIERVTDGLSDDELAGIIDRIRTALGGPAGAGEGAGEAPQPEPAEPVPTLQ